MRLVINEWLWADAEGASGKQCRAEALAFTEALARSQDQIIVIQGSPFDQKMYRLLGSADVVARGMAGIFVAAIRFDPDRCVQLHADELATLDADLLGAIKDDDRYLVLAQAARPDSIIITSDGPLLEALRNFGIPAQYCREFIRGYLGNR